VVNLMLEYARHEPITDHVHFCPFDIVEFHFNFIWTLDKSDLVRIRNASFPRFASFN